MKRTGTRHHLLVFSRRERTGLLVLLIVCLVVYIGPIWLPRKPLPDIHIIAYAKQQNMMTPDSGTRISESAAERFLFDPNTATEATWLRLGVSAQLTKRILNYTGKGGRFRQPSDLHKIWGMPTELAGELMPYVQLPVEKPMHKRVYYTAIDLNAADTSSLQSLPGIGPVLAKRIVQYREQYGSIIRLSELLQVKGMSDSLIQALEHLLLLRPDQIKRYSLNRASVYVLGVKAEIPVALAKQIIARRQQEGPYRSWQELMAIPGMDARLLQALQSAFTLEE